MRKTDPRKIRVNIPISKYIFENSFETIVSELNAIKDKYGPDVILQVEAESSESYGDYSAYLDIQCYCYRMETPDEVTERIKREKETLKAFKASTEAKEKETYERLKKKFEKKKS